MPEQPQSEPYWAKPSLAIFNIAVFAAALAAVLFFKIDKVLDMMVGATIVNATTIVNYYFGSSSGSAHKTALMASKPPEVPHA